MVTQNHFVIPATVLEKFIFQRVSLLPLSTAHESTLFIVALKLNHTKLEIMNIYYCTLWGRTLS